MIYTADYVTFTFLCLFQFFCDRRKDDPLDVWTSVHSELLATANKMEMILCSVAKRMRSEEDTRLLTKLGPVEILTTQPVNSALPAWFAEASPIIFLTTAGLNLALVGLLAGKDRTPVNLLILADCLAGCVHSGLASVQFSPVFRGLAWPAYCAAHLATVNLVILINRSVAVAIAVYRYLLGVRTSEDKYKASKLSFNSLSEENDHHSI